MKTSIRYDKKIIRDVKYSGLIDIDLYKSEVRVFVGKESETLAKYWEDFEGAGGLTQNYLKTNGDVWIRFCDKPTYEFIAHESCHAATMILDNIGHNFNGEADEPLAYLTGYITKEIIKICKKKKIRISWV